FSPDRSRLLSASNWQTSVLVWDVSGELGRPLAAGREVEAVLLERWWGDLRSANPAVAYRAVWRLVARPGQAVPLLRGMLRPVARTDRRRVARLIEAMDDERFSVRERAREELQQIGDAAAVSLLEALEGRPSLEQRRRLEELLGKLEDPSSP